MKWIVIFLFITGCAIGPFEDEEGAEPTAATAEFGGGVDPEMQQVADGKDLEKEFDRIPAQAAVKKVTKKKKAHR